MNGVVVRSAGLWYKVRTDENNILDARLKGAYRMNESRETNPVAVGDHVTLQKESDGTASISEIHARNNHFMRRGTKHPEERHVLASNIDQMAVLFTIKEPFTPAGFVDRLLITAESQHIPCLILFNKTDILSSRHKEKQEDWMLIYGHAGYRCCAVSATDARSKPLLLPFFREKITLLAGLSGSGKSTIIGLLNPGLSLKTQEISKLTKKGKHTTALAEMHQLIEGGFVIDSPGIREAGIADIPAGRISHYFPEMRNMLGGCKYNDCTHTHEPGCAVKAARTEGKIHPERYNSYLRILRMEEDLSHE